MYICFSFLFDEEREFYFKRVSVQFRRTSRPHLQRNCKKNRDRQMACQLQFKSVEINLILFQPYTYTIFDKWFVIWLVICAINYVRLSARVLKRKSLEKFLNSSFIVEISSSLGTFFWILIIPVGAWASSHRLRRSHSCQIYFFWLRNLLKLIWFCICSQNNLDA